MTADPLTAASATITDQAVTLDDIRAAAARLAGVAHRTPVLTSRTLDNLTGARVYLKAESLQRAGAFKFRGAYNALATVDPEVRARGVVAYSSGNHAQAVALAAQLHGVPATILMPEDAPASKFAACRGYGADVLTYDRYRDDRVALGARLAADRGATLIPSYDHPAVVAGAGTVALELLEDVGELDLLLICVGGGGLLAGCAVAAKALQPGIEIVGVEPAAGDDWAQSLVAGEPVKLPAVPRTIADGQQIQAPGALPFVLAHPRLAGIALVTDDEIRAAMTFAFERLKLVLEPSGATALAALLAPKLSTRDRRIGVTLSGGNIDLPRLCSLLVSPPPS